MMNTDLGGEAGGLTVRVECTAPADLACGLDLAESAVLIATMADARAHEVLKPIKRTLITQACPNGTTPSKSAIVAAAEGEVAPEPAVLIHANLSSLPGRCELGEDGPAKTGALMESVVARPLSGGGQLLSATVSLDGRSWSGDAVWPGGRPPPQARYLGRLVALGCAYASDPEAGTAVGLRLADIVQRLDAELGVNPPLATFEGGIRQGTGPAAAEREFRALEDVSRASNWWRCSSDAK